MTKQQPVNGSLGKANPGANKRRILGLWGAISLLTAVLPASAVEIVNDTWIDGNRNQPASPTYSENGTDADADGKYDPSIVLDFDYTVLMPRRT